jgi:demethylspheroidene O-methyltransferase
MVLLLDAACALKLVQTRSRGRYGLGSLGAALRGNPGVIAMIAHHDMLYGDLADPIALLRGRRDGALARYWPYATGAAPLTAEAVGPYTALMAASQPMISEQVLTAYDFVSHRHLLDVGGGDGSFLRAVLARNPALQGSLFDLPPVAEAARARFEATGFGSRAHAVGGSFLGDPLPQGADIISLIRIIHDHDDPHVMTLLRAVHHALPNDGTLLIAEPISGAPGSEAVADAYFAFYLLAMGSGRPRSFPQISTMLADAGFTQIALKRTAMPMLTSVIVAKKTDH